MPAPRRSDPRLLAGALTLVLAAGGMAHGAVSGARDGEQDVARSGTVRAALVGGVRQVVPPDGRVAAASPGVRMGDLSGRDLSGRDLVGQRVRRAWMAHASWYGAAFAGRRTASGEPFDPGALTAAHRRLPFGTRLRVTNPHTGRGVVVRINDRGPWVAGRDIDLSRAAARAIGLGGVGPVRLERLAP